MFRCFDVCSVRPPQIFQVQAKISAVRPVFPDYLSGFYDYPIMKHMKIFKIEATLFEYIKKSCDTWLLKFRNH